MKMLVTHHAHRNDAWSEPWPHSSPRPSSLPPPPPLYDAETGAPKAHPLLRALLAASLIVASAAVYMLVADQAGLVHVHNFGARWPKRAQLGSDVLSPVPLDSEDSPVCLAPRGVVADESTHDRHGRPQLLAEPEVEQEPQTDEDLAQPEEIPTRAAPTRAAPARPIRVVPTHETEPMPRRAPQRDYWVTPDSSSTPEAPPTTEPSTSEPPVTEPPTTEPPATEPSTTEPPTTGPTPPDDKDMPPEYKDTP
ncbi:MAG TPA: hypothetical protein VGI10_31155 [Polyangiaceae bacterium]|jgi:hypothetical protein